MKRTFRIIRFSLWIIGFAFLTVFLIQNTPWHKIGFFRPDYPKYARQGTPIVSAIYKFRSERGLWPQYLADLAPDYLPTAPALTEWFYNTNRPVPQLIKKVSDAGVYVGYEFDPTNEGWKVWGAFVTVEPLTVTQPKPSDPKFSPDELARRGLKELDRRIAREPMIMDHYQTKVALLRQLRDAPQITALLTDLVAKRPLYFWPHMALAVNELFPVAAATGTTLPDPETLAGHPFAFLAPLPPPATTTSAPATSASAPAATAPAPVPHTYGEKFVAYVEANPSFANYYFLHTYATLLGNDAAALLAAQKALACPLDAGGPATQSSSGVYIETSSSMDFLKPEYYAIRIAAYLYRQGQYQDVIDLCNRWESAPKSEQSYFALRAAALLALGKFDAADGDVQRASIANDARPLWAKNLPALGRAITDKNQKFVYDSGFHKPYEVFAPAEY